MGTDYLGSHPPPASQFGEIQILNEPPIATGASSNPSDQWQPRSNLTPGRPELLNKPLEAPADRDGG